MVTDLKALFYTTSNKSPATQPAWPLSNSGLTQCDLPSHLNSALLLSAMASQGLSIPYLSVCILPPKKKGIKNQMWQKCCFWSLLYVSIYHSTNHTYPTVHSSLSAPQSYILRSALYSPLYLYLPLEQVKCSNTPRLAISSPILSSQRSNSLKHSQPHKIKIEAITPRS